MSRHGLYGWEYEETDHYVVTKGFLSNPARTLSLLLNGDGGE